MARSGMAFTLRQLRYFVAAAEAGTISGAAQSLSISQSSVTEAVKELEADLGVRLFERGPRGLKVTRHGRSFLRHATEILGSVSTARRAMAGDREALQGRLSLGVTGLVAGYILSDVLARFRRANPAVEVSAVEDAADYLDHLLIGGELDVAVAVLAEGRAPDALQAEIVEVSPYRLWLPLGHPLEARETIELRDVAEEPLIMLTVDEIEGATVGLLGAFGARPRVAFRTRSVEAVRSLVATGAGVALLPDLVYRPWSLEGDRIQTRDVAGALPIVRVAVLWRRGAPLSETARAFVATAQAGREARRG